MDLSRRINIISAAVFIALLALYLTGNLGGNSLIIAPLVMIGILALAMYQRKGGGKSGALMSMKLVRKKDLIGTRVDWIICVIVVILVAVLYYFASVYLAS